MNYISIPTMNIRVLFQTPKSTQTAYIEMMFKLYDRNPWVFDRIYSYMAQDFIPRTKQTKNRHIVTMRKEDLVVGRDKVIDQRKYQIVNKWYVMVNQNATAYANKSLPCIEEAIGHKIIAVLEEKGISEYNEPKGSHWNVTKEEHAEIVRLYK